MNQPEPEHTADQSPAKTHVLIAEDNRLQAKVLEDRLVKADFRVSVACDGEQGLELARNEPPEIIVSDIEMPNMTGYEFCRAIKSDADLKSIPFILLSTLSDAEDIIRGLDCGADNYVTKPYRANYLISRMNSLLQTPLEHQDPADRLELTVNVAGNQYTVRSGRQQVLNLLVSTFENAVEKNRELLRFNEELAIAKEQLAKWNRELERLNGRMSRDLDAAAKIQQSLLPSESPETDRLRFGWKYLPCDELAGDFLNFFRLDDQHIALFVVDVSGHGVPSSLLSVTVGRVLTPDVSATSLLVTTDSSGRKQPRSPSEVVTDLNRRFPMEDQGNLYFTMVYAVLNERSRELRYVSAGHNAIVHAAKDGEPKMLPAEGFAVGWMEDADYDEVVVQLSPGDRIYLYSDGVPEALDEDLEEFDEHRMLQYMKSASSLSPQATAESICDQVLNWCRVNGPKDDITMLVVDLLEK